MLQLFNSGFHDSLLGQCVLSTLGAHWSGGEEGDTILEHDRRRKGREHGVDGREERLLRSRSRGLRTLRMRMCHSRYGSATMPGKNRLSQSVLFLPLFLSFPLPRSPFSSSSPIHTECVPMPVDSEVISFPLITLPLSRFHSHFHVVSIMDGPVLCVFPYILQTYQSIAIWFSAGVRVCKLTPFSSSLIYCVFVPTQGQDIALLIIILSLSASLHMSLFLLMDLRT